MYIVKMWQSPSLQVLLLISVLPLLHTSQSATYNPYPSKTSNEYQYKDKVASCGCLMGPAGTPGHPGNNGVPGMPGSIGLEGRKGEPGSEGKKGEPGMMGPIGPPGPEGKSGNRGKKGLPGAQGKEGDLGPKGDKGDRGYAGLPGAIGPKGDSCRPMKKVAFSVARSTRLGPVTQDTAITFDVQYTNIGEGFDVYSSHFVCKQNGTYMFITHILGQNNKDVYAWIMLNDKHKVPLHGDGRAGYGTGSQTIILQLRVDDHVWIQLSKDSGLLNDYTTFSGYLLFDD